MPACDKCGLELDGEDLVAASPRPSQTSGAEPAGEGGDGEDVRCPSCGAVLPGEHGDEGEETHPKAPWHFKVLVVGSVGYLGYRLYQGIGWLIHHA